MGSISINVWNDLEASLVIEKGKIRSPGFDTRSGNILSPSAFSRRAVGS